MTNTPQPNTKRKDPTQERLDNLRHHLVATLELTYALAAELSLSAGREQSEDKICNRILAEFNTLSTLRTIQYDPNRNWS